MRLVASISNWWTREAGGRDVLAIALPLMISTGFFSLTLFIDRMFLLWHSQQEMAASMPAGMLHWTMVCLPIGLAAYANTFVAQYYGAERNNRIGRVIWQSLRIGLYATPLFLCTIPLAPRIFAWAGHSSEFYWHEVMYFQVLAFGAGAAVMSASLSSFFTGRGVTRVVMVANIASAFVNIGLDYAFIFGRFGFPELGIEGAAWATVAAQWFKFAIYCSLFLLPAHWEEFQLNAGRRWDFPLFGRLCWFGAPSGLQVLVQSSAFMLVTMKMGKLGTTALAAATVALNINAVAFIPMIGVGIAVSTLVGQQLTRGHPQLAARTTWTAAVLAVSYNGTFALAYLFAPELLMWGHAAGISPQEFGEIRALAIVLLRFVAAFCMLDALHVIFVGAIKGAGDTWFVLANTATISWASVAVGFVGEAFAPSPLMWWWCVITCWVTLLGVTFMIRFLRGKWITMRVIEAADDELPTQLQTAG